MDQLVREETQRLLSNQMREAKLQRQIQVLQQALAWTEATRRKFEEAREKEIKELAAAVTGQVQNTAIQNIEELTRIHDLEMAEIGMAHRAAAGFQNVERLKSLKRLKNETVAKNRGSAAIIKHAKEREAEAAKSMAILKRKEEVRKLEDKLSKDLISRRPLSVSNTNPVTASRIGPPEYQHSIAKTLRTASTAKPKPKSRSATAHSLSKAPTPSKVQAQPKSKLQIKSKSAGVGKDYVKKSSSSNLSLREREQREQKSKEGALKQMVRIKASAPSEAATVHEDFSAAGNVYGVGVKLRHKYAQAARGEPQSLPTPVSSQVRYFDANVPQGEVKYLAPDGLSVKESRKMYSPDAWQKGRKSSEESVQRKQDQALKDEEVLQKAAERGKLALKKAKIEKELAEVKTELLTDVDYSALGTGNQQAILGLENEESQTDSTTKPKRKHEDKESTTDSTAKPKRKHDNEESKADGTTKQKRKHEIEESKTGSTTKPKKKHENEEIKTGSTTNPKKKQENEESKTGSTTKPKKKHEHEEKTGSRTTKPKKKHESESQSSDEFSEVDEDESYEFPTDSRLKNISKGKNLMPLKEGDHVTDQQAIPGLQNVEDKRHITKKPKRKHKSQSSDEFTEVDSEEGFEFPPDSRSKNVPKGKGSEPVEEYDFGSPRKGNQKTTPEKSDSVENSTLVNLKIGRSAESTPSGKSKRRKENRPVEDKISKKASSRRPLSESNTDSITNESVSQPPDKQHIPKTSKVGSTTKPESRSPHPSSPSPAKVQTKHKTKVQNKSKAANIGKDHEKRSSSSDLALRKKEEKSKDGDSKKTARAKDSAPSEESFEMSTDSSKKRPKNISEGKKSKHLKEADTLLGKDSQPIQKLKSDKDKKLSSKKPKRKHESQSSDEFTEVDSEEGFEFSPDTDSGSKNISKPKGKVTDRSEQTDDTSRRTDKPQAALDNSDSTENSTLLNLKILEKTGSTPSGSEQSSSSTRSRGKSSSADNSTLVNLKILEKTESTPTRSEQSTSSTTDYYSPPDGPFTSTPDGKLHHKSSFSRSEGSDDDPNKSMKKKTLYYYLDKFLKRRPDSIEHLPVSSSSSSVIRADSDVLSSDSYKNTTSESVTSESLARSSIVHTNYTLHRSDLSVRKGKKSPLREQNDKSKSDDSGSTIAETAIRAGPKKLTVTTSSGAGTRADETSFSTTKTSSSGNDEGHVSSDSLAGLLRVLSNHQDIEKRQSRQVDYPHTQQLEHSSSNSSRGGTKPRAHNKSSDSADTSGDSIPDASAVLRRLISRQAMHDSSRSSSGSSPKSGPEKEDKRVELLSDVTPIKFYETPPRAHQRALNESEIISDVFENLFDKLSNLRIEKPPWVKSPEEPEGS